MKKNSGFSKLEYLPTVMTAYIVAVLPGMLLVYHDFYYDILETKLRFYSVCTIAMLLLAGGYLFLTAHPLEAVRANRGRPLLDVLSLTDCSVLLWGLVILLSTIFSPEKREAFWGLSGRYTGCFLLMLYVAAYFCITRHYRLREWHMALFLAAGFLMCLLGITDFFDMDLLHFKADILESQRFLFCSTIGNINTYTSCVAMVMAFAGVMAASVKDRKRTAGYGICTVAAFAALILGESDNAYLSLAAFFGFLPFYLFRTRRGTKRYFVLAAAFFTVIKAVDIVQARTDAPVSIHGLFQVIAGNRFLPAAIAVLWIIAAVSYGADHLSKDPARPPSPWLMRGWLALCLLAAAAIIWVLYDVNALGNPDRYGGLKDYLLFNDEWGTHRGYIWRIGIEDYQKFPLLQKLFGYGPDTFGIVTHLNNMPEMVDRYNEVFDSAHNEYLQYFVTIGPFGLLAYLAIHVTAVMHVAKKKKDNPLAVAALFAVLCYASQAFVNINQPIAAPVMWTLLAVSVANGARETEVL